MSKTNVAFLVYEKLINVIKHLWTFAFKKQQVLEGFSVAKLKKGVRTNQFIIITMMLLIK